MVPVQKEKAPDERRTQQTLLNRDQVEKNLYHVKAQLETSFKSYNGRNMTREGGSYTKLAVLVCLGRIFEYSGCSPIAFSSLL